jgi:hypothetical protein
MNLAAKIVAVLVVGALLGLLVTWLTVFDGTMPGGVSDGPWSTNLAIGSPQSDPYTRASTAVHGLLALNREETLYYTATRDGDGRPLDGGCRYAITGRDPDTRWWSITAYGNDDFLVANPANRYSVAMTTIARAKDGGFSVQVGGLGDGANWIPTVSGRFSLTLRLYNPAPTIAIDPEHATLPSLKKVSCP